MQRNLFGNAFLHHVQIGTARQRMQLHLGDHGARQRGVVERIVVAQQHVGLQLAVGAAERVPLAIGEIGERHAEGAANMRMQMLHGAGEAIGRQPLCHRIGLKEGAIDPLGAGTYDAVERDGGHGHSLGQRTSLHASDQPAIAHHRHAMARVRMVMSGRRRLRRGMSGWCLLYATHCVNPRRRDVGFAACAYGLARHAVAVPSNARIAAATGFADSRRTDQTIFP